MSYSGADIWIIIAVLGIGTFLIRFSFLGLFGDRTLPTWALDHLRYTPVAIMPGLIAPILLEPQADGSLNWVELAAAGAALAVGLKTRNTLAAVATGAAVLTTLMLVGISG